MANQDDVTKERKKSGLEDLWSGALGCLLLIIGACGYYLPGYSEISRKALILGASLATYQVASILLFPKKK